jgi:hypothetical protein
VSFERRVLEQVMAERGVPGAIRCDNGPQFTSRHFLAWCVEWKIELLRCGMEVKNAEGSVTRLAFR